MTRVFIGDQDVTEELHFRSAKFHVDEIGEDEQGGFVKGFTSGSFSLPFSGAAWDQVRASNDEQYLVLWGPKNLPLWRHWLWNVRHFVNYWLSTKRIDLPYPTEIKAQGPARIVSTRTDGNVLSAEYEATGEWTLPPW
jgi:hypothetical protein